MKKNIIIITLSWLLTTCINIALAQVSELEAEVSKAQLLALQATNEDILLLDVRTEEEYNNQHIPGAKNISHTLLPEKLSQIAEYKDKNIVVYCRSGRRAQIAIDILKANGFNHVSHLTGDMLGWNAVELPHKTH
ncbi:rhodanese-like domain-containing protein [Thalassotalea aquiviva]|uniref:rhodanese-like domain-containing protein n=1 Tax=Thalassotalea aquiviva TaxID=3242415 RepID=UPI00352A810B